MDLTFNEEETLLRSSMRRLFEKHCTSSVVRSTKGQPATAQPTELWNALTQASVFELASTSEDAESLRALGLVMWEAGRVLCPSTFLQTATFGVCLRNLGSVEMQNSYLREVEAGRLRGAVALWQADDASCITPQFSAIWTDKGWQLDGECKYIAGGLSADVILVSAIVKRSGQPDALAIFDIKTDGAGCSVKSARVISSEPYGHLSLEKYIVPAAMTTIVEVTEQELLRMANIAIGLQCMDAVGGCEAVLERTAEFVKGREQFNRPIGSFQAVQQRIADMRIRFDCLRLTALQALWTIADGKQANRQTAIAKIHANESYKFITLTAHVLHGGMGIVLESDLHLFSERAKVWEMQGGNRDVAAKWLYREDQL